MNPKLYLVLFAFLAGCSSINMQPLRYYLNDPDRAEIDSDFAAGKAEAKSLAELVNEMDQPPQPKTRTNAYTGPDGNIQRISESGTVATNRRTNSMSQSSHRVIEDLPPEAWDSMFEEAFASKNAQQSQLRSRTRTPGNRSSNASAAKQPQATPTQSDVGTGVSERKTSASAESELVNRTLPVQAIRSPSVQTPQRIASGPVRSFFPKSRIRNQNVSVIYLPSATEAMSNHNLLSQADRFGGKSPFEPESTNVDSVDPNLYNRHPNQVTTITSSAENELKAAIDKHFGQTQLASNSKGDHRNGETSNGGIPIDRGNIEQAIGCLKAHLSNETMPGSQQNKLAVCLRLLQMVAESQNPRPRSTDSAPRPAATRLTPTDIRQLVEISDLLTESVTQDPSSANSDSQISETLERLRGFVHRLSTVADLKIANISFCTEVAGYGQFRPSPNIHFQPGDQVLVYCEVENYSTESCQGQEGSRYCARLRGSYFILDAEEKVVADHEFAAIEDRANKRRDDFYVVFPVTVPDLAPGDYRLFLLLDDQIGYKSAAAKRPLNLHVR